MIRRRVRELLLLLLLFHFFIAFHVALHMSLNDGQRYMQFRQLFLPGKRRLAIQLARLDAGFDHFLADPAINPLIGGTSVKLRPTATFTK